MKGENNFAFIDSQNVYRGIQSLGWKLDWRRFRIHLTETYRVTVAYLFIGYIPGKGTLYTDLQKAGFILKFKPVSYDKDGRAKGNVDADMVLQAMIDYPIYDEAVIVTSDGDFYSLVRHLYGNEKLCSVLSPYIGHCSKLLKKTGKEKVYYMDNLEKKIGVLK